MVSLRTLLGRSERGRKGVDFLCKEKLPWLIIKHEERQRYFNALEEAQVSNNIVPFMNYIQSILDHTTRQFFIQNYQNVSKLSKWVSDASKLIIPESITTFSL
ncbi:hypothetical protein BSZ32_08450, partial [Rubritalea profundi]